MKVASVLATVLFAAGATAPGLARASGEQDEATAPAAKVLPLPEVSRAFTEIDAAAREGRLPEQRSRWLAAAAASPGDPGTQVLAAYALPHDEETWAGLKRLTGKLKDSAIPWVAIWRIYLEWGVLDQIDRSLPIARVAEPDDWMIGLTEAMVAERRGRAAEAGTRYQEVLARDAGNIDARVGLARLAQTAGDEPAARQRCDEVLAILPGHAPALEVLAALAEARGDLAGSAALLTRVVKANAGDRATHVKLARLLLKQGDAAGSRDQWKAALAIKEDTETLVALAEAARLAGDTATERRSLERLAGLEPGSGEWRRIAEARVQARDVVGAERALRQAVARDAKDPLNQAALGRLLAGTGRIEEGLDHLRTAGDAATADREAVEKRINYQKQTTTDVAALQRSVGRLIDATYRRRLKDLPRLSGKLSIRVTTDAAGRAALVEVIEDTLHDDDVRACAYWNLKDAAYPAQKQGRSSFSFTLRPGR